MPIFRSAKDRTTPPLYGPAAGNDGRVVHEPASDAGPIAERPIPAVVSAAWELELLIAGAVTFALLQLPGSLDALLAWVEPRATGVTQFVMFCGYVYAKAIVYILLIAFLLNLVARAYWVGLVGLHSVFPRGILWDRMGSTAGPLATAEYRRRLSSLPAVIARVDNFASVIFSFAFLIVLTFVLSVILMGVLGAIATGVSALAFGGRHVGAVLASLGAILFLPMMAGGVADKVLGTRLDPAGRGIRVVRGLVRYAMVMSGTRLFGPIYFTLFTNLGKRVALPLFYIALLGAMVIGMGDFLVRTVGVSGGGSPYLPDEMDIRGVDQVYYESLRHAGASTVVPTIQSDVIEGPYVRLFIPYQPDRHDPWMRASCPGATPIRSTGLHLKRGPAPTPAIDSAAARTLACLARLHAVAVDGTARPDLALRFYTHPITGRNGVITYIPTAPLASGMHTIVVRPPPRRPSSSNRAAPRPYEIPFWR